MGGSKCPIPFHNELACCISFVQQNRDIFIGLTGVAAGVICHRIWSNCCSKPENTKCMQSRSTTNSGSAVYESARAVDEYLKFHFQPGNELCPFSIAPIEAFDFPTRCAKMCQSFFSSKGAPPPYRALDLGCAVGRASFDLTLAFDEVVGIDFSQAFIDAANTLKTKGVMTYTSTEEGAITSTHEARVPSGAHRDRVQFMVGDACDLPSDLGTFDAVLAANLLCRLPAPRVFLERCRTLVKPGGVLVLVSPYSWLEEYTPMVHWVGGYFDFGNPEYPRWSRDEVTRSLSPDFELVKEEEMPFLIREHRRKYQLGVSHATVWRRKTM
eukprot:Rmarinus@m.9079